MADQDPLNTFIRAEARRLRDGDVPPKSRPEWERRRAALRERMLEAIGPVPGKPSDLEPRLLGALERDGYRIEKLVFQSRPDVWVTASAYVPALKDGQKVPAVLVVHGHWAWARRDPVVQARCLGLVKLGFFVLAVDAFGSGERYTKPARGTYHGALYGSTLWPTGYTLLGMQVYDNRRAVDYLLSRKEVNGKVGITGASGGGNQSMYAGAIDDRLEAVVPVCSVGNFQSYLRTACCVCEVLPGALSFTEEGDVLGLVAPRALLVMNASRDGIQFSPAEAEKSLARAKDIYGVLGAEAKVRHLVFDSGHDYNRPMREAMYGWMTLHLKGEGKGDPVAEPAHTVEKPEDLACFPDPDARPKGFLTPPLFAAKAGQELVAAADRLAPTHPEMWEATANNLRATLKAVLGEPRFDPKAKLEDTAALGSELRVGGDFTLAVEPGVTLRTFVRGEAERGEWRGKTVEVSLRPAGDLAKRVPPLDSKEYLVMRPTLRGTREQQPKGGAIAGAPDHNPAEHGVWIGRPLLGQWMSDVVASLWAIDSRWDKAPITVVGVGPAAIVALAAVSGAPDRLKTVILVDPTVSLVTSEPYASGTPMGILAPGLLKVGDIPHLAALIAPRRLVIAGAVSPQGRKLGQKELEEAFRFTAGVYKAVKAPDRLTVTAAPDWARIDL